MKIHLWNAFASNNSGSYTIVGSFPSEELASAIATELSVLMREHTDWLDSRTGAVTAEEADNSPLANFLRLHGLRTSSDGVCDWPQYGTDNTPQAFAIDSKVIIHHEYTVTLPREFGEYFYSKGGRVEQELNHSHNPIVAICEIWQPWQQRQNEEQAGVNGSQLIESLCQPDGAFVRHSRQGRYAPAWRAGDGLNSADLTIGAVFDDLPAGFAAVNKVAREMSYKTYVKVFEAFDEEADPLAFLRPSSPPVKRGHYTVALTDKGLVPAEVVKVIEQLLKVTRPRAREILDAAPVVLLFDVFPEEAEAAANSLRKAGAKVEVT
jgi:ribosomal protein L7/L12